MAHSGSSDGGSVATAPTTSVSSDAGSGDAGSGSASVGSSSTGLPQTGNARVEKASMTGLGLIAATLVGMGVSKKRI